MLLSIPFKASLLFSTLDVVKSTFFVTYDFWTAKNDDLFGDELFVLLAATFYGGIGKMFVFPWRPDPLLEVLPLESNYFREF